MPRDNGKRVVEGARSLSPGLSNRMLATRVLDHGFFIRELLPQDMKLELDQLSQRDAMLAAGYLARVVGIAHARQMDMASGDHHFNCFDLSKLLHLSIGAKPSSECLAVSHYRVGLQSPEYPCRKQC